MAETIPFFRQLPALLRGDVSTLSHWAKERPAGQLRWFLIVIVIGTAAFGAAIGLWRSPLQAFYTALKLPLVILLTTLGNALINGMLAPQLGINMPFRQSLRLVVMSFVIMAAILGAFSPLAAFLVWNVPPISTATETTLRAYQLLQLGLAGMVGFAGSMANVRLLPLLRAFAPQPRQAWAVLWAWLLVNLLLGSQICWMLRPFVGKPDLAVEFLGPGLKQGNFFETIFTNLLELAR